MITQNDLTAAIAECEGARNPNANTCLKLAALYTIRDNMQKKQKDTMPETPGYSYAMPAQNKNAYESNTDFGRMIENKDVNSVLLVFDELMNTLRGMIPRLYDGVLVKLQEID